MAAEIVARWPTGNTRLSPATATGDRLIVTGEAAVGVIDRRRPGRLLWSRPLAFPGGAVYRPRVTGGVVVGGGTGGLAAWSLADGRPLWQRPAEVQTGVPALDHGLAVFGDGHHVVAVDPASGRERWRFAAIADTLAAYAPAITAERVFVGPGDGRLYALSTADGRLLWQVDRMAEWQYLRQLQVEGDLLVAGSYKEKLHAIDAATGSVRWHFNAGNFINSQLVADGAAHFWSPTGWIYAIELATGAVRWRHRTTDFGGGAGNWAPLMAELVAAGGRLYALAMDDVLHVLSLAHGTEILRLRLPEPVRPFVVVEDRTAALFGTTGGDIVRVRLA